MNNIERDTMKPAPHDEVRAVTERYARRGAGPYRRVRELFPRAAALVVRRVTLAPPISRLVCRLHPAAYHVFNAILLLRTHALCWIEKGRA